MHDNKTVTLTIFIRILLLVLKIQIHAIGNKTLKAVILLVSDGRRTAFK